MFSTDTTVPALPVQSAALPHKAKGLGTLEKLPPELVQQAVDLLADDPHALAGFSVTSELATAHTNQGLKGLVPPALWTRKNLFVAWDAQRRTLPQNMQDILKATSGHLPCPNIFKPIDHNTHASHDCFARALTSAEQGFPVHADNTLRRAEVYARKASIPMPETRSIMHKAYANGVITQIEHAREMAEEGDAEAMNQRLRYAVEFARQAGTAVPNIFGIEVEGYSRAIPIAFKKARIAAETGSVDYMLRCISDIGRYAGKANIAKPCTKNIERMGYLMAIPIEITNAQKAASIGEAFSMEKHLCKAKHYALGAGAQVPDICNIYREGYIIAARIKLAKAREEAKRGHAEIVAQRIREARHFATQAGLWMPDTRDIEHESYVNAIWLTLAKARRSAEHTLALETELWLERALFYAQKAEMRIPESDIASIRDLVQQH